MNPNHVLQIFYLFVPSAFGGQKRADAYKAQVGLFAAGHDYEEQVAKVIEITHVKEYHDDEGERVA